MGVGGCGCCADCVGRLAMRALLGAGKKGVVCLVASTAGLGGNYIASKKGTCVVGRYMG